MRLRWRREKAATGLASICANPPGWEYHDGENLYATVDSINRCGDGWYWVAGWDSDVPHKNTRKSPCDTPEEAKTQATAYVKMHLSSRARI
jgi:hypothetical protein